LTVDFENDKSDVKKQSHRSIMNRIEFLITIYILNAMIQNKKTFVQMSFKLEEKKISLQIF
jgi:hypothetical protein